MVLCVDLKKLMHTFAENTNVIIGTISPQFTSIIKNMLLPNHYHKLDLSMIPQRFLLKSTKTCETNLYAVVKTEIAIQGIKCPGVCKTIFLTLLPKQIPAKAKPTIRIKHTKASIIFIPLR